MRTWGRLLGFAAVVILLGLIPLVIGWSHMPDPTATHWGINGVPDGRLPLAAVPWLMVGIVGVGLLTTSLFRVEGRPTAEAFAMVGLLGVLGFVLMASLVHLNWDAPSWEDAGAFSWLHLLAVLVGAIAGGWGGYLLGRRWYPPPTTPSADRPVAFDVADGESVTWIGTCSVRWPFLVLGAAAVLFLALPGWFALLALLFMVLAFLFSRVYVTVSEHGLDVRLGGRIRARRLALDKIVSARPIDLEPAAWGGWGWRVTPGGSAIVLRRGDAIEVTFENDRRFAVTVDDAATGAALLNGLRARLVREA